MWKEKQTIRIKLPLPQSNFSHGNIVRRDAPHGVNNSPSTEDDSLSLAIRGKRGEVERFQNKSLGFPT